MTLLVEDLPGLMSAPAALLLAEDAPTLDLPLPQWRVRADGAGWRAVPERGAGGTALPLPAAPGGLLGVLSAGTPAWLEDWPGDVPALLPDATALSALLAARLLGAEARLGDLAASLTTLRAEHEEGRVAMAHWLRSAGQEAPQPPTLLHADTPQAAPGLPQGLSHWRRVLPLEVAGMAAVALHLGAVSAGPGTALGVRLVAEESGRVAGAWRVPGEALSEGWLMLDLPMPAPPWRETAALEITAALAPHDVLALSMTGDAPAVQLLRARGAARFLHSPWWLEEEAGRPMPPEGVWCGFPASIWQGATRIARVPGHGQAMLEIPALPLAGFGMLRAELRLVGGSEVQAALECAGRGTGWVDAQRDGHLAMSLAVSPAAWPVAPVRVQLRALGGGGGAVEWREIRAVRGGS